MTTPPETRDLALRLLACESNGNASEPGESASLRVYEKLRQSLGAFAGPAGFQSLAARALVLARSEAPGLRAAHVAADGSLKGLCEPGAKTDIDRDGSGVEGMLLIGHLLGLLFMFLGEALTFSLLRRAWPGTAFDERNSGHGRKP